jgi:hypothetical protein
MRQIVFFALAWYGAITTIWDVLGWLGISSVKAGWIWKGNFKAGLLDFIVVLVAFYATQYLLRHSLSKNS